MRNYNLVLVLEPESPESERKKILEKVTKWFGDGKIENIKEWGKKTMAYQIKKFSEGFYLLLEITTENTVPLDFEKKLIMEGKILRHLLVKK